MTLKNYQLCHFLLKELMIYRIELMNQKEYYFNRTEPKGMKFFRFEVLDTYENFPSSHMQLGEFRFGYTTAW